MSLGPASPSESPFGRPLDPAILAEPLPERSRAFPTRIFTAVTLPLAALAGSSLLQRLIDGPLPVGDAAGAWQHGGALVGAPLGLVAGLALSNGIARRLLWLLWGALSPLLLPALVAFLAHAALPLREVFAERGAAVCRQTRKVCSVNELNAVCSKSGTSPGGRELLQSELGEPAQTLCDASGCTYRWLYAGPWTPNNWPPTGSLYCSLVVDAQGRAVRAVVGPGPETR